MFFSQEPQIINKEKYVTIKIWFPLFDGNENNAHISIETPNSSINLWSNLATTEIKKYFNDIFKNEATNSTILNTQMLTYGPSVVISFYSLNVNVLETQISSVKKELYEEIQPGGHLFMKNYKNFTKMIYNLLSVGGIGKLIDFDLHSNASPKKANNDFIAIETIAMISAVIQAAKNKELELYPETSNFKNEEDVEKSTIKCCVVS